MNKPITVADIIRANTELRDYYDRCPRSVPKRMGHLGV